MATYAENALKNNKNKNINKISALFWGKKRNKTFPYCIQLFFFRKGRFVLLRKTETSRFQEKNFTSPLPIIIKNLPNI